jgi:hypothetical protein
MENVIGFKEEFKIQESIERSFKLALKILKWIGEMAMRVIRFVVEAIFARSPAQEYLDEMRLKHQQMRPF